LDAAKQQLLSLLAKVNNPDTSFEELADLVKQNATLSHQLLVLVNQPQINLPSKVDSLQMALKYLGLVRIKLWITTLMMGSELDRPSELLTISLTRARFCELFAEKYGHVKEKESYFLVGLFSNLDAYFRMPMRDVVAQMPLSESLTEALVEQKGEMAITLKWINQFELGGPYNRSLKVPESSSVGDLNRLYLSAVGWAQEIRAKEQANSLADGVFAY
jgi:EAL and modified HD-GYP domain-containing signal transduction protein